ncbi:Flagellar biosynthetic protein FlhB [Paraconexibacter sp. AEG42_29]|uniref:Flagellar biosynthetic protein FlhB n=1 Tax=Paraconexibacter sp. AEG42_29 TaxID=2997339 RepID=A0AAU7ANU0_9ACTN
MAGEKTEKATPKRREEARKKGQVGRSQDLGGAVILMAGLLALGTAGPAAARRMGDAMRSALTQIADPSVVSQDHVGELLTQAMIAVLLSVAPIAAVCIVAGVAVNVVQVGFKPSAEAMKPDPKRLNPVSGAKNIFGPNMFAEALKSVSKVAVVGAIVFAYVAPKLTELGAMVGIGPQELAEALSSDIRSIAMRAAMAYFLIGCADYGYQKYRTEKSMKMEVQEVKEESKGQNLPPEVRAAMRRRQMSAARARMMADVPTADVIVTNPTHFAVALKYDGTRAAPMVIAKGQDLMALRIRELAEEAGVPRVEDRPLARSLFATCEVGHEIPEDLYAAVAQVLAFVYRLKARRRAG